MAYQTIVEDGIDFLVCGAGLGGTGAAFEARYWGKDKKIVIAPLVNPDGFFSKPPKRTNSRGVDINRNFPTRDWRQSKRDKFYTGPSPNSESVLTLKPMRGKKAKVPRIDGKRIGKATIRQYWNPEAPRTDAASRHSFFSPSSAASSGKRFL